MSAPTEISPEHLNFARQYAEGFANSGFKPGENDSPEDWMLVNVDVPEMSGLDGQPYIESLAPRERKTYAIPKIIKISGVGYDIRDGNAIALDATVRSSTLGPRVQVDPKAIVADSTIKPGTIVKSEAIVEKRSYIGIGVLVDKKAHTENAAIGNKATLKKEVCVHDSTVGDGVYIDEGSKVTNNSNVSKGSRIGKLTELDHVYLDEQVIVGDAVSMKGKITVDIGAKIDDHARIRRGVHIGMHAQILRYAEVECDMPEHGVAISTSTDHVVNVDRVFNFDGVLGTLAARKGRRSNS